MNLLFNLIKKPSQQQSFGFGLENQEFTSSGPNNSNQFDTAKQLQNFNNEMSQIQIGNQQIDQDSIDQIKKQHKLLSGRRQTLQKLQNKKISNESDSSQKIPFNGPVLQNKDSDKKSSKLSIQSKFGKSNIITRQNFNFKNRQNNNKNSSQSGLQARNYSNQLKKSKSSMIKQITKNITNFNTLKKDLIAYAKSQQTQLYRLKIKLIRTFQQKLEVFLKQKQKSIKNNQSQSQNSTKQQKQPQNQNQKKHTRNRSNAQDYSLLCSELKIKLQQKEEEIQQIVRQNQALQQHIFDIQQRIVGVDLQVEQKLQEKKKQIQQKIMKNIMSNSSPNNPNINGANIQTLKMLTQQNESLSKKVKNYQQNIDQFNKKSEELQEKQFKLQKMQQQIMDGFQNLQQQQSKLIKKQSELSIVQKNLNYKLNSLKQQIKQKQIELLQWQNQIQKRIKRQKIIQKVDNQLGILQSQSLSTPRTPQLKNNQSFGLRLPLAESKRYSEQHEVLQNTIKTQRKAKWSETMLDSFCKRDKDRVVLPNKHQFDHIYDGANDQTINANGSVYDPKKHQQYQKFDYKQRINQQSSRLHQQSVNPMSMPIHHQIKKVPQFYSSKVSSKPLQFYQPTNNNSFRYQPQYKPASVSSSNLAKSNLKQYIYEHRKLKQDIGRKPIVSAKTYGLLNTSGSQSHHSHSQSFGNLKYQNVLNRSSSKDNNVKLTSLGNKLQELKAQIKHQIDSIN